MSLLSQMGYGKRALQQLAAYYTGDIQCLDDGAESSDDEQTNVRPGTLQTETIVPR